MLHSWLQYAATALSWSPLRQQQKLDVSLPLTQPSSIPSKLEELPGGSPLSLCEVSRSTDLFQISSVELTKQPLYFEDAFEFNLYGTFQDTFLQNATIELGGDCGSHCEEYGRPPDEEPGDTVTLDFCDMSDIQQPLGHGVDTACPPEKGWALVSSPGYVWKMFLGPPGWYNFTFDARTIDGDRIYCLTAEVCLRWEDEERNRREHSGPWSDCQWPR